MSPGVDGGRGRGTSTLSEAPVAAEQAYGDWARALKAQPDDGHLRLRVALALWQQGRETEATATLHDGLRRRARDAALAHGLGMFHADREEYRAAEEWFHRALEAEPRRADTLYLLGLTYAAQGRFDEAYVQFQQALQLGLGDARIRQLAQLAARSLSNRRFPGGSWLNPAPLPWDERTADKLAEVVAEEPECAMTLLEGCAGEELAGQGERVLAALEAVLARSGGHADLQYQRGLVLERLGRLAAAVGAARRALRVNPRYAQALILLGRLYSRAGRPGKAAAALEQAAAGGAGYADVRVLLGQAYQQLGRPGEAREQYEKALALNGNYQAAREALARLGGWAA